MEQRYKIIINWLFVLLWMGVIYYFSAQPDLKSELQPIWDLIFRKIAHMAEFFILAFLLFRAYFGNKMVVGRALFLSVFIAIIYAVFDEYHQTLVEGRTGSPIDVVIDSIGVLAFGLMQIVQIKKI